MSRSYRKNPMIKSKQRDGKKEANKKVRRSSNFSNIGSNYKKCFPQYDVCEFVIHYTEQDVIKEWYNDYHTDLNKGSKYKHCKTDLESEIVRWKKDFYWK